jgi:hypothetical protein
VKNKVFISLTGILLLTTLTGCGNKETTESSTSKTKGNCTAVECVKQISPENTVEEINNIIGVDGELTDETYNKYYWELSEDSGVEVTYYSSSKGTIVADIDRDILANSQVDFSRYDELQPKVNDGITYSEFISYIGNVEGTIIEKSSYSTKYVWVASDGSYLNATFSNSSNKCTFVSGMIK